MFQFKPNIFWANWPIIPKADCFGAFLGKVPDPFHHHLGEFPTGGLVAMKFVQQYVVVSFFFSFCCVVLKCFMLLSLKIQIKTKNNFH